MRYDGVVDDGAETKKKTVVMEIKFPKEYV